MSQTTFDLQKELPSPVLEKISNTLIGFEKYYEMLKNHLMIMLMPDHINKWSKKHYKKIIPLCDIIQDRYPLFLFSGDVGNGYIKIQINS